MEQEKLTFSDFIHEKINGFMTADTVVELMPEDEEKLPRKIHVKPDNLDWLETHFGNWEIKHGDIYPAIDSPKIEDDGGNEIGNPAIVMNVVIVVKLRKPEAKKDATENN